LATRERTTTAAAHPKSRLRRLATRSFAGETLTQRASLNMLAAAVDYAARVIVGLLLNPLLVSRLGDVVYGVYQVLGRLIGVATPAGGRPSQALKWTIAHDQASTDYDAKRRQVGSALVVWVLFLPPLAVAGGVLGWFAPLWLDVPASLDWTVRLAALLLVVDLIVTGLATIPWSVLQGENLGYKRLGLSALVVIGGGALTALLVLLGAGLIGVAAATLVTTVASGALFWWVVRANVPWFGIRRPSLRTAAGFTRLSGWFLLWSLVMQLMRGSDVVVLGIAGSTTLVTVYVLTRYVPETIFGGVAIMVSSIMPGVGGLLGAGDLERVVRVRSESMAATWLIATALGSTFLVWGESFLGLWVGESYYPGETATVLIVLMVLQLGLIRNDAAIIDLTLELRAKVLLGFLSAGASIALAVLLVAGWDFGITGLVVGFIAGRSILSIGYPWLIGRFLAVSPSDQVRAIVRPALVTTGLFAGAVVVARYMGADFWLALLVFAGLTVPVASLASFYGGLSREQRRRVSRRLSRVIRLA
jgi:O-antigen/teichoic acid export membrane protein